MRAVMIEGPSREGIEPIELGSCALCQLVGEKGPKRDGFVSLRFGSFESRSPVNNDLRQTRAKGISIAVYAAKLNLCRS